MKKLGFDTWIYELVPIEEALKRLRDFDVEYGEFSFGHFMKVEQEGKMDRKIGELKDLISSLSMRMVQMHAPFGDLDRKLGSSDDEREKAIERVKLWLGYANKLDVDSLVMHTIIGKQDTQIDSISMTRVMEKLNIKIFGKLSKHAKDFGVKIAIENRLESIFGCKILDLLEIVKNDPDNLGICLDTGHANVNAIDLALAVEQAGDNLIATHIHDNDGSGDQHLPPLMGSVDWKKFINAIEKINYKGPLIVEIPGSTSDLRVCDNRLLLTIGSANTWLSK